MNKPKKEDPPKDVVTWVKSKGKVKKYVNGKPVKDG